MNLGLGMYVGTIRDVDVEINVRRRKLWVKNGCGQKN